MEGSFKGNLAVPGRILYIKGNFRMNHLKAWGAMAGKTVRTVIVAMALLVPAAGMAAGSATIFNFLRNDVGARAAALAGSFTTMQGDPDILFYNPAGLATIHTSIGAAGFFKHLMDINAGYVTYSTDVPGVGRFGAGIVYTNYGTFDQTDELGSTTGTFGAGDLALSIGYALPVDENVYLGGALKGIYSSIGPYSSSGVAADLGVLYTIPASRFAIGASIRNLGMQLSKYGSISEDLPLDCGIGASIVPKGLPLLLNVGVHRLNDDAPDFVSRFRSFTVGGEFQLSKVVMARVGYDNARRKDYKIGSSAGLAGFSAGLGILVSGYTFDYALSSLGKAGNLHRISIRTTF